MAGHECFHCKQWVEKGVDHDCWTTTEGALTRDLREDLKDAWKVCYFFVRPKPKYLELCVIPGRPIKAPQVRNVMKGSRRKWANMIRITHRDEVEAPITDWIREAYEQHDELLAKPGARKASPRKVSRRRRSPKRPRGRAKSRA